MLLKDWLKKNNISGNSLAGALGLSAPTIYRVSIGKGRLSPKIAVLIEAATKGQVTRTELMFPEDYIDEKGKYSPVPKIHFELVKGIDIKTWHEVYETRRKNKTKKKEEEKFVRLDLNTDILNCPEFCRWAFGSEKMPSFLTSCVKFSELHPNLKRIETMDLSQAVSYMKEEYCKFRGLLFEIA